MTLLVVFYASIKKQSYCVLRQMYDTFDVFYSNLCEVRLCACFTLNFVLIYVVLAHVLH
jgi:hypothetical protein